ncbi:MAG TPA: SDR family NAD(P)-dependent oxidoreductase [Chitinophagaceae bacterium]|nr:SDR family NAD(P)-dependent oxidoreductase [Chitinophagaceae bacterium]
MKGSAIIIGASQGLGRALAYRLAEHGTNCILASRNEEGLWDMARDLTEKHKIKVVVLPVNLETLDASGAAKFVEQSCIELNDLDKVFVTAGYVSEADDGPGAKNILDKTNAINYRGPALLLSAFSEKLKDQVATLAAVSSIAAIRPRGKNIGYAASKIALEYHVKGLAHFFSRQSLRFQIYRVGYMDTGMSAGKKLAFRKEDPSRVATFMIKQLGSQKKLFYYPRYWRFIAWILGLIPWFIYKKLRF